MDGVTESQGYLFACPVDSSIHWWYLRFALRNAEGDLIVYQWKCLPFGLATTLYPHCQAPGYCSSSSAFAGVLHVPYIINIIHAQASFCRTCRTHDISLCCHINLGFIANLAKSALVLSQVIRSHDRHGQWDFPPLQGWRWSCMQPMNCPVSPICRLDASKR